MSTFSLKIISTDKVFYDGKCEYLVIPTIDGEKGILAHHENMVIAVEIGELRFRKPDGEWVTAVVSKGFAEIVKSSFVRSRAFRSIICHRLLWPVQ